MPASSVMDLSCAAGAGRLRCGFTPACNLKSIVGVYYGLFNYSDDIYQRQLYGAVSYREGKKKGASVFYRCTQRRKRAL